MSERGLLWAVGLSRRQNVYPADVALIFPVAKAGSVEIPEAQSIFFSVGLRLTW